MARVKDLLLDSEYKEMEEKEKNNLKEYVLTINSEYIEPENRKGNYYILKYCIMELNYLMDSSKAIHIQEQVLEHELDKKIHPVLFKIIHETNQDIDNGVFTYKALINNGWLNSEYLFEAIPKKLIINSFNDLLVIKNLERAKIHYLHNIAYELDCIGCELADLRVEYDTNMDKIIKGLELHNYISQH